MKWYSLGLAAGIKDVDEGAWRLAWEVSQTETGSDPGNAIFSRVGADNRLILYFSPSSQVLAESFGARPCGKPPPSGLQLIAGSERAWRIHFGRMFSLRREMGVLPALRCLVSRPPAGKAAAHHSALHESTNVHPIGKP